MENIVNLLDKAFHLNVEKYPPAKRRLARFAQFLAAMATEFKSDNCVVRAQGMAYTSLLALVPLFVITFITFSAFPAFEQMEVKIQTFVLKQFVPDRHDEILIHLEKFTSNVQSLGVVGLVALLFTAVLMLDNIEKNFNGIWQVSKKRKAFNKLTAYTTLLVFGTFFIGASFSITAKIKAYISSYDIGNVGMLSKFAMGFFPFFLTFMAFLLMYKVIPYTKVKIRSAVVGGLIGSLLWELAKNGFWNWAGVMVKNDKIYGSLALIPTFLIWLYITWMIVLIGLEIAYTHQNFTALIDNRVFRNPSGKDRLALALKFFSYISNRFYKGNKPPDIEEMADRFDVPIEAAVNFTTLLVEKGLIHEISGGNEGFIPSRSLDNILVHEVVKIIFADSLRGKNMENSLDNIVNETLDTFEYGAMEAIGNRTMLQYIKSFAR